MIVIQEGMKQHLLLNIINSVMRIIKTKYLFYFLFLLIFTPNIYSQTDDDKNIVIVNKVGITGGILGLFNVGMPEIKINEKVFPATVWSDHIIYKSLEDSVQIKVFYFNLLFKKKEIKFNFKLNEVNNYFVFKYKPGLPSHPRIKQITKSNLEKFKNNRRVKKIIKKYNLE